MQCVIPSCDSESSQSHLQCFPRSRFLCERWCQAIELGTGQPFPRDVDPLETFICQQHFGGFDGYQEPVIFLHESLHRQVQLDSCRLCLKVDFSEQIVTGCGNRIVVEKTVKELLRTAIGVELSEIDCSKGLCTECLERLAVIESTLIFFCKKNDHWLQMQDMIKGESVQWHQHRNHGTAEDTETKEQIFDQCTSPVPETEAVYVEAMKVEFDDSPYVKAEVASEHQEETDEENLLIEPSIELTPTSQPHKEPASQQTHAISGESSDIRSPFTCQICQKSYSNAARFKRHQAVHQNTAEMFPCQYCQRQFQSRRACQLHERFHENKHAYTCEICSKSFTHPANLKRHQRLHVGTREYCCDTCGMRFTRLTHVHMHQQAVHRREKPYVCPKCGKIYGSRSGMVKHRRNESCR